MHIVEKEINIVQYDDATQIITYFIIGNDSQSDNAIVQQSIKTSKVISSIRVPSGFDYTSAQVNGDYAYIVSSSTGPQFTLNRLNIISGELDSSFQITFSGVVVVDSINLKPAFDFETNRVAIWLQSPYGQVNNNKLSFNDDDNSKLNIPRCTISNPCNYLYVADLNEQTVINEITLDPDFGSIIFIFGYLSGDYVYGVSAANGTGIATLDITNGNVEMVASFNLPYNDVSTTITACFLDSFSTAFVNVQGENLQDPPYFIVYDIESSTTVSNIQPPLQNLNLFSIFAY